MSEEKKRLIEKICPCLFPKDKIGNSTHPISADQKITIPNTRTEIYNATTPPSDTIQGVNTGISEESHSLDTLGETNDPIASVPTTTEILNSATGVSAVAVKTEEKTTSPTTTAVSSSNESSIGIQEEEIPVVSATRETRIEPTIQYSKTLFPQYLIPTINQQFKTYKAIMESLGAYLPAYRTIRENQANLLKACIIKRCSAFSPRKTDTSLIVIYDYFNVNKGWIE